MSSLDGMGVAATVVFTEAVETGPTNKSQRSSHVTTIVDTNAVGLVIVVVPLSVRDAVAVGIIGASEGVKELLCETTIAVCNISRAKNFILALLLKER